MFSSLYANILYPLLASMFVVVVKYDLGQPTDPQVADFGSDLCVLALGAVAAVINNPLLLARWGTSATINVGLGLGVLNALLVVVCVKVRRGPWAPRRQAKTIFSLGDSPWQWPRPSTS